VAGQLIVSVSGISDRTLADVDDFCGRLDERGVHASFLVGPRIKGGYRLDSDTPTVEWLGGRRAQGDVIVLHGFDEAATKKRRGEFATLPAHEANLRLMAADRVLEHLGLRTRLFAAPGWTVSQGTVTALPRNGFRLLVGLSGITDLVRQTTVRAGARHRRGLPERAVVVPDAGVVRRAHLTPRGHRPRRGGRPSPAQARTPAGHARRHRPGVDAPMRAVRVPLGPVPRADRRSLISQDR